VLDPDQTGAPISPLRWGASGSWTLGPLPVEPDGMPPGVPHYQSWSGADANTGVLSSNVFAVPTGNCVAVGAAHGPSTIGLSLRMLDGDTGKEIASLAMNSGDLAWRFFAFQAPDGVKRLTIVAEDQGRDWGQWLAVGPPLYCR
jgi:hypothetical protein